MLLPDNVKPELSIFYNGSIVLKALDKTPNQKIMDLYENVKKISNMSYSVFVLSLDWLYLIDAAIIDNGGVVRKCL